MWADSLPSRRIRIAARTGSRIWGKMAFDATGKALYVASATGLSVLGRDPDTGMLTDSQLLPGNGNLLRYASLLWDPDNTRLLVVNCEARAYAAVDGTFRRLRDDGPLLVTGERPCSVDRVFMDPMRKFLYVASRRYGIRVFAYDGEDTLRHIQTLPLSILDAVISNEGQHVYAVERYTLYALERDQETGELAELGQTPLSDQALTLTISDDDGYLFTFGENPAFVYDLGDPASPQMLRSLTPPTRGVLNCSFSVARNERHAADAFCTNSAYVVQWNADDGDFALADFVSSWHANRLGERLPAFGWEEGLAASPDGRHAYLSTREPGILIFERVGNPIIEVEAGAEDGYVRLGTLKVSVGQVALGPPSSGDCITIQNFSVNDIHYDVDASKWQTRPNAERMWRDIEDTETRGEVCAYTPTESGQYRMVVEMDIDGEAGQYGSNVIDYESD